MNLSARILMPLFLLLPPVAYAGAEMEILTKNPSGQEQRHTKIYAQSNMIRMDEIVSSKSKGSMIFLNQKFLYLDHEQKQYMVIDKTMLDQVSAQISKAMAEMEKQLAGMPPEQRAMVEQMMKGQMQGMMGKSSSPQPAPRVESIGSGEWQSYDCEKFAVFEAGRKTQEVCAADLVEIDGIEDVMEGFRGMTAYIEKMAESMPMMANDGFNPGEVLALVNGFPVHIIDFANGKIVAESSLESVTEKDLEPELFTAPVGYTRMDPLGGL